VKAPAEVTHYARSGGVHIAYQVVGNGPIDLVFSPSPVSNLEVGWEWPPFERFLRRLASFSRLILFDKRGTGLSDRVTEAATLEERMDDVRAVMDAADSERAALFGSSEGGPMALLFAATYPSRVSELVLYGSYAKAINGGNYHSGVDLDLFEVGMKVMAQEWGNCALIDVFSPSVRDDEAFRQWWGRYERQSASPGAAVAIQRLNAQLDVRAILPSVKVPTLVLYRAGEFVAHVEGSKYLADNIVGAQFEELVGDDYHPYVGDQDAILDRIEEFLTGARRPPLGNRVLATLLSIDIGDQLRADRSDPVVAQLVDRFGGGLRWTNGNEMLATFDGPSRAIESAVAITEAMGDLDREVRIGAHIGEIETNGEHVAGAAVGVTCRIRVHAARGQVVVSRTLSDLLAGSEHRLVEAGEFDLQTGPEPWKLFAVLPPTDPLVGASSAGPTQSGVYRREGDVWLLTFGTRSVRVRDSKGIADIAMLLSRPGREVHVAELVGASGQMGDRPSADRAIDDRALSAYRIRLSDLDEEQDEAEAMNDPERAQRARDERDALVERLSADLGLGGRARTSDDWTERARKAVRTRVASALKKIEVEHPALGRHLRASIRTGAFCAYEPPEPVAWEL
jgi:pimeloyl-ACP methyl ester carboxylesterase